MSSERTQTRWICRNNCRSLRMLYYLYPQYRIIIPPGAESIFWVVLDKIYCDRPPNTIVIASRSSL